MSELVNNTKIIANKCLSEVIDEFVSLKRSKNTRRAYRADLTQFFNTLPMTTFGELADMHFSRLINAIREYIEDQKKVDHFEIWQRVNNPRTLNRKVIALRVFFDFLISVYRYPQNPLSQFKNFKTENCSNTTSLSRCEIFDLLKFAKGNRRNSNAEFRDYLIWLYVLLSVLIYNGKILNYQAKKQVSIKKVGL